MITISNLSHTFDRTGILADISFEVPSGGVTALIGPNGAGKSTLLSLMARLLPLQSGSIFVDDLEVGKCPSDLLARKLAILPQRIHVSTRLSVEELIGFGRYPHSKGRFSADDQTHVQNSLEVFGLQELAGRQLDTLSGGQRQRAYLAMSYAQDTDYLLLDEPLNNLDIAATRALLDILTDLAKNHGRTIVIVVHDINVAARYADYLVALRGGALVAQGKPVDIIDADFMGKIYDTDAEVILYQDRPVVLV